MDSFWQDLRYSARMLVKSRSLTLAAVLAIALGTGANTAVFSVVNGILLRPLPYESPNRLVVVFAEIAQQGMEQSSMSLPDLVDLDRQSQTLEGIAAFETWRPTLVGTGEPERLDGGQVSADFFRVLRVQPYLGRDFHPEEDTPEAERVVLLSHGLWRRRFGSDPAIVGKSLTLAGSTYEVLGVLPASFQPPPGFLARPELWRPLRLSPTGEQRDARWLKTIARLGPDVPLSRAQAEATTIARRLAGQYPDSNREVGFALVPLREHVLGNIRPILTILIVAVTLVLLIACADVASLLLVRAITRQRETVMRIVLGAGRGRLVRQLLVESILLALIGGAFGLLLAYGGLHLNRTFNPGDIPRIEEIALDGRTLAFSLLLSLVIGVLFGLAPALMTSRLNLTEPLKESGASTSGAGVRRFFGAVVALQVALALVLLVGAGLLTHSLWKLRGVDPGFSAADRVLTMQVLLPSKRYPDEPAVLGFYDRLFERLRGLQGVEVVAGANMLPLGGSAVCPQFSIASNPPPPGKEPCAENRVVTPDYFRALDLPVLQGRAFSRQDRQGSPPVIVVNQTMARQFWNGASPLGDRVTVDGITREVVGIVADLRHFGLDAEVRPELYIPRTQDPWTWALRVVIRSSTPNAAALASEARNIVWSLDANLAVAEVQTLGDLVSKSMAKPRFRALMLSAFAAVALLLAVVGIYGILAYSVSTRTQEIGIRMALGAAPGDVVRLVLLQGAKLAVAGLAIGLTGSFLLSRFFASFLFGVAPADPLTYGAAALAIALLALLAIYLPARSTSRVSPKVALTSS